MQKTLDLKDLSLSEQAIAERKAQIARRARAQEQEDREQENLSLTSDKLNIDGLLGGQKANSNKARSSAQKNSAQSFIQRSLEVAGIVATTRAIQDLFENVTEFARQFGTSVGQTPIQAKASVMAAQDDDYIYDTVAVSQPTAEILNKEAEQIEFLIEELKVEKNPQKIARMTMELEDLTTYYNMRPHPMTGMYVHDYHFIQTVESIHNPNHALRCIASVNYYRPKFDIASERGIKRGISDVYNQNPAEVELTRADAAAHVAAQPLPPTPRVS